MSRQFGLVGALISLAFASFQCEKCGPIPRHEFHPIARAQMTRNSILFVIGAIAAIAVLVTVIVSFA